MIDFHEKQPPYSRDMEEAVLGAMMMDKDTIAKTREIVSPDDFYLDRNRRVFSAMCALQDSGSAVDPLTLIHQLEQNHELESSGGRDYISYLIDVVPTTSGATYHAGLVKQYANRRRVMTTAMDLLQEALEGKRPISDIVADAQSALLPIAAGTKGQGFRHASDVIPEVWTDFDRANNGEVLGQFFGFRDIDRQMGGMLGGELCFLCGVPGGLKTILLLIIMLKAAMRGEGAAIFSAEMMAKALIKRLVQYLGQVLAMPLRTGLFKDDDEADRIGQALGRISRLPLWIDQTPTPDINLCMARARALKALNPNLKWIGVDFIQLLESQASEDNRSRELTSIAYKLKGLAKELDVAVIATCQVDAKAIESRTDKRPRLGDLQWSQGMRQAADLIALLYRPSLYSDDLAQDVLEIDFQKARDLAPFKVSLWWEGKTMRLGDL